MVDLEQSRQELLDWMSAQLIGPVGGPTETLGEAPNQRYLMGTLFPQATDSDAAMADDEADDQGGETGEDSGDDRVTLHNQHMPSSVGLSFVTGPTPSVDVEISGALYAKADTGWTRVPFGADGRITTTIGRPADGTRGTGGRLLDGRVELYSVWRPHGDGFLVTVALINPVRQKAEGRGPDPSECLFQVGLTCRPTVGPIRRYPSPDRISPDPEAQELALLYRRTPTFAIGHGCATSWVARDEEASAVSTEFLPVEKVPDVVFDIDGFDTVRSLPFLAGIATNQREVVDELDRFVNAYRIWVEGLEAANEDLPLALRGARDRIMSRLRAARDRMESGVRTLESDDDARRAFAMANEAMQMQIIHSQSKEYGGSRRRRNETPYVAPDYLDPDHAAAWRPFQLAFLLLTITSAASEDDTYRDVVDLIWFPTGGGKTEAYLGLVAFSIFLRRGAAGDAGAGTTVITRYTLRLLTSQQFRRAAALVCACEIIRRREAATMGNLPVSIGIWLGNDSSPGTYADAVKLLEELKAGETPSKSFQLELCPWCGTEIIPADGAEDDESWGVRPQNASFAMFCPSDGCPFHADLPASSVDHHIYDHPPTVLIGTIDKFARLTWEPRSGSLLGSGTLPGPSLIIQDELHLISGPLGTITGLYEAAFDVVMRHHGARPKIIASTATIRRAEQQVRGLFGRDVFLFPPAGLTSDDSYFVRFDPDLPGRLYAGVMSQSHTSTTAMVHTAAAMLQGPAEVAADNDERDRFWTLVAYHNSLRELGKTVTLASDDIPARIKVIASVEELARDVEPEQVIELTSNVPASSIPSHLEKLAIGRDEKGCVSFVACTNMISVGVDVDRLDLMLVVGQPKSTSEYIQATSRVGRKTPGLVVTLYSAAKPRDRSHYESFRTYHHSIYRQVEPTSVTPFSLPARQRALHAALVILVRCGLGLAGEDDAALFDEHSPKLLELTDELLRRAAISDPREADSTERHLGELVERWVQLRDDPRAKRSGGLRYQDAGRAIMSLLKRFNGTGEGWPTLDSMRNVDVEVLVNVRGQG